MSGRTAEWGEQDSNLRRQCQRVYSASPLAARTSPRALAKAIVEAGCSACVSGSGRPGLDLELRDADLPPIVRERDARLHLHPHQPLAELRDEARIGAVADREVDSAPWDSNHSIAD